MPLHDFFSSSLRGYGGSRSNLRVKILLFLLLIISSTAYLHRVPGLFGDEASEGQNVYDLLHADRLTITGERSYIGPLIDYIRTPFVLAFGYKPLSLRLVMLAASLSTFWLATTVFTRLFGQRAAMYAAAFMFFSPMYVLKQRLGWAITLFPFFAFLTLFFATSSLKYKKVLTGLAAGLGLHNYFAFLPTIAGIAVAAFIGQGVEFARTLYTARPSRWFTVSDALKRGVEWWLALLGFWAAFGTQFAVMQLWREDQGNPAEVMSEVAVRIAALPKLLPMIVSGSSYVARYTGSEFSHHFNLNSTLLLGALIATALMWHEYRKNSWRWLLGLGAHLAVLLVMIDRYTLRYFVIFVLGMWALAGVGFATALARLPAHWQRYTTYLPVAVAVMLLAWTGFTTLRPYLRTGGSTAEFSLGNRNDTSAHFADSRQLLACVSDSQPVFSRDAHLYNMLLYRSYDLPTLIVPESAAEAHWLVEFRKPGKPAGDKCPELTHYRVVKRK